MAIGMGVLALLVLLVQQASAGEYNRVLGDKCEGCMIVHGVGYNSFKDDVVKDCTCYYHCTIDMDNHDMVAYKMCCPCGMGWSQKLCECVKVKHPLSDCVQSDDYNPCIAAGVTAGDLLPRYDPERADSYDRLMCKGYFECIVAPGQNGLVPVARCCEETTPYFDTDARTCVATTNANTECTGEQILKERCCEARQSINESCALIAVDGEPRKFINPLMGDSVKFLCPPNMEFDADKCACIRSANWVWPVCPEVFKQFHSRRRPTVNDNNWPLWTERRKIVFENVDIGGDIGEVLVANFNGDSSIIMGFLSHGEYGRTGILCFQLRVNDVDDDENGNNPLADTDEAVFTNCINDETQDAGENTIKIWVSRNNDGTAESLHLSMDFYDTSVRDPMATTTATLDKTGFESDKWYTVYVVWCGPCEKVWLVCREVGTEPWMVESASTTGGAVVTTMSGLVEGYDLSGSTNPTLDPLHGDLAGVKMWRGCKPKDIWEEIAGPIGQDAIPADV